MCTVDEKAASIRLNFALTEIAPVEDYTHRLTIFIKMNNPTEDGLSSNEEYPILCDIEDEVVDRLETLEDIFAGTVKTKGRLELYLFTKNPEKIVALDISFPQVALVKLKMEAFKRFSYEEMLKFIGVKESDKRAEMYEKIRENLEEKVREYWDFNKEAVQNGVIHMGKFEKFFRLFR